MSLLTPILGWVSRIISLVVFFAIGGIASAQKPVTISWNPNSETDLAGYRVNLGTTSGQYPIVRTVVSGTSTVFADLDPSTLYYCAVQAYNSAGDSSEMSEEISFTTSPPLAPKMVLRRADGTIIQPGATTVSFGNATVGNPGNSETLSITNEGNTDLSGLGFSVAGSHPGDFLISSTDGPNLAPGESTSLTVTFSPDAAGNRSAVLLITNDADIEDAEVSLTGSGSDTPIVTSPEIIVQLSEGTNLPDGGGAVDFGTSIPSGQGIAKSFTIRNSGSANLILLDIAANGNHAADFIISTPSATTLPAGASTSFTVTFRPGAVGTRNAALHIISNDADESPYDIALSGTGISVPEISVTKADGTDLTDGAAGITFAPSNLGGSPTTHSITIKNTGTANLSGLALAMVGTHASEFTTSSPGVTTLVPGASASFNVTFMPAAAGPRNATLHISSNDADENPFDISLAGTGVAIPEIAVKRSDQTDLKDGSATVACGQVILGASGISQSFTITNHGTAALTSLTLGLSGNHAGDFTKSALPATALAPGASMVFSVTFKPSAAGPRNASLQITSNDADENPFDIALSGIGVAVPEIAVENSFGSDLVSGNESIAVSSGTLLAESTSTNITLRNLGSADLTGISTSITGTHATDFSIAPVGTTSLAPGSTLTIKVTFTPSAPGARTSTLSISSNDADENPFIVSLTGNAVAVPDINLTRIDKDGLSSPLSAEDFGSVELRSSSSAITCIISNHGSANLNSLSISTVGLHAQDFVLSKTAKTTLQPGETTSFTIEFKPRATGERIAAIRIESNDADEATIDIPVSGTGFAQPEIDISAGADSILEDGADSIDFGSANTGAKGATKVFTIRNTGTSDLTGLKTTMNGIHAEDFTVSSLANSRLAPGASITFKVQFRPGKSGKHDADLQITSNDADESRFNIHVEGEGIPIPKIEIRVVGGSVLTDEEAFINFGTASIGSSGALKIFTITNRGDATLTGIKLIKNGIHAADFSAASPKASSLEPGKSVSFKVQFKPRADGTRWAAVHIASNDPSTDYFDIVLTGKARAISFAGMNPPSAALPQAPAKDSKPVVSSLFIDGLKYRCITIPKNNGSSPKADAVEVSSNLVDWASGAKHTTVIKDNAAVLIVRDNRPLTPGSKRYIRLR